ncbi:DNA-binding MarR family transcriptional regulator [Xanthomonas campestris]|uniref:MarR family winged helix-turn-helix transcriptional regulator n=1 Tax=Xanthomonas sp. CFBP 8151 TaxID=3035310 RepID=UPI001ABAB6E1|nr:MarR family transcriptional regulator [Xanthomonas campestris pv. campestris]NIJ75529.1 DNA-binding MarR family transcriptional regulator [Xanthomonas sp. CFBP 8151]
MAETTGDTVRARQTRNAKSIAGDIRRFERSLAALTRLLGQRLILGDIAARCGYNLPPASWALLEYLDSRGAMRVSELALCYGVDVSSVTPRIKSLEKLALIDRGTEPADARVSVISISAQGQAALESVHAAQSELIAGTIAEAGIDPAPVSGAATLLEQLVAQIDGALARRDAGGGSGAAD